MIPGESRRLRWAVRAYPRAVRDAEGDVLISLACDLLDTCGSSINREALGLVRGGLTMRLGRIALAPWETALRRASIAFAGALLAIVCGVAAATWPGLAYPGEAWLAALVAPAAVVAGQLAARRVPIVCGALVLLVLGVLQSNIQLALPLSGSVEWSIQGGEWQGGARGFDLPLLSCALPGSLLLLVSAASSQRAVARSSAAATAAWIAAAALGAYLTLELTAELKPVGAVTVDGVRLNGLGLCIVVAGLAALACLAVRGVQRRRDPSGMLAATLTVAAITPVVCLYVVSALPLGQAPALLALAACVATVVAAVLKLACVSAGIAAGGPPGVE